MTLPSNHETSAAVLGAREVGPAAADIGEATHSSLFAALASLRRSLSLVAGEAEVDLAILVVEERGELVWVLAPPDVSSTHRLRFRFRSNGQGAKERTGDSDDGAAPYLEVVHPVDHSSKSSDGDPRPVEAGDPADVEEIAAVVSEDVSYDEAIVADYADEVYEEEAAEADTDDVAYEAEVAEPAAEAAAEAADDLYDELPPIVQPRPGIHEDTHD